MVISPSFDKDRWSRESELWKLTLKADPSIEAISVGEKQFEEDGTSMIIEAARQEGVIIRI